MKRVIRILTVAWVGVLLAGAPASAARMDSIDISGSDATYQAEYEAYTQAASAGDAAVCEFTVGSTAASDGALCRIELPDDSVYLYMDEGDLAVMMYNGSQYKKFKVDYQLKTNVTYTLCVFQDGLAFFDGSNSYTYTGDFSGFTDVKSGWSEASNQFEVVLTKREKTAENAQQTASKTQTDAEAAAAAADAQSTRSRPSGWVITALILAVTANILALIALRTALIARRRAAKHAKRRRTPERRPQVTRVQNSVRTRAAERPRPAPAKRSEPRQTPTPRVRTGGEIMDFASVLGDIAEEKVQPPAQPFDLYLDRSWREERRAQLTPYRFGDPARGLCTFVEGHNISSDPFVLLDGRIWLNPVRFHPRAGREAVPLNTAEAGSVTVAFDFYRVNTSERAVVMLHDAEMLNFRPAKVKENAEGILELAERGIIVFEQVQRTIQL